MSPTPPKPATYEDLLALPENVVGQIIDGELIALPRPALRHARVATTVSTQLGHAFDRGADGPGGWLFLIEPELRFGADVVVPDLAAWRRERLDEVPDAPWLELAPDWVCEVLSPSTASLDRVKKMRVYARERITWYWILDPIARTLEVFRLGEDGSYVVDAAFDGTASVRARPFDAIELELTRP
ncbi:MAG: Uma2 family endonuclease [Polyangiaceae bacterium]|nr:Uma2 family endonuclease [Polyangiaceae bacterium]